MALYITRLIKFQELWDKLTVLVLSTYFILLMSVHVSHMKFIYNEGSFLFVKKMNTSFTIFLIEDQKKYWKKINERLKN